MKTDIKSTIEGAFADVARPTDDDLVASQGDEETEDSEHFRGKNWQAVDPTILPRHHYAVFWFTPEAFHYYLPTFLSAGVEDPGAVYVVTLLQLLRPTNDEEAATFRRERWSLLTDPQIQALEGWLSYLVGHAPPGGEGELQSALRIVRERYWWN